MKNVPIGALIFALAIPVAAPAASPDFKIVQHIKIPDGGFDYVTFDSATHRVYVARTTFTTVVDSRTGATSQLNSAAHGHMVVSVPGTALGVLPVGAGKILIVDTAKDTTVATLDGGMAPDAGLYDPFSKSVFVMNHKGGDVTMVDPVAAKITATIPVGGTLEFAASDGMGRIYDNIESKNAIAVIDVKQRKMVDTYKLADCDGPTGLAYAAESKLLISACDGTAKVLRAADGKELASLKIGHGADAVIYDPKRKLAFIPCSDEGVLDVVSLADTAHIAVVQEVQTPKGTRTGTVDPENGKVFLVAAQVKPKSGGEERAGRVPGTYEILVVSR